MQEVIEISKLKKHPRNYNNHPQDQLDHIKESIREHGIYRNIVIAKDNTILAGHGVVEAAIQLDYIELPCKRLDIDPFSPRALKVLTGDNELSHLSEKDDRALSELLKEIKETDIDGLLGTGYDEMMLANLVLVTRPQHEIQDFNEAAEWMGLPEYRDEALDPNPIRVSIAFRCEADKQEFAKILGLKFTEYTKSSWWPAKRDEDLSSLRFDE